MLIQDEVDARLRYGYHIRLTLLLRNDAAAFALVYVALRHRRLHLRHLHLLREQRLLIIMSSASGIARSRLASSTNGVWVMAVAAPG